MYIDLKPGITQEAEGLYFYEFGIRKPAPNIDELLSDYCWRKFMNKWVWSDECDEDETLVFFKHFEKDGKLYQVIYSGIDIIGDGVYVIYDAHVHIVDDNFFIDPGEFELLRGSWEEKDFLKYLCTKQYITKAEFKILSDKQKSREWTKKLRRMRTLLVPVEKKNKKRTKD